MSNLQRTNKGLPGPPQPSGHIFDPSDRQAGRDATPGGFDKKRPGRSEADRDRFAPLPIIPF
jgi:hypothetical protein